MTNPLGYCVTNKTAQRRLLLDKERAIEQAVSCHGHATPMYSIQQIVKALEEKGAYDPEAGEAVDAVLGLGLEQL